MVPKLIGTKELENQQYIGQTPHRYENESHAHLIQFETWWSFPYILGQRKKTCQRNYMKLKCMLKTFKNRYQNTRKNQVKRIPNGEIITWKISLKDTSRNEISIGTHKKDVKLPKERMVPNKPSSLQSFMMAQGTKKETACLPPTHT